VKLGRGGIREIEFIAQTLQLLNAGRTPFLQNAQTLPTLAKLAQYRLLTHAETDALTAAYGFLRDVEHRLQMDDNRQTHTIPVERAAQERLARLMGFATLKEFNTALREHTTAVRAAYDRLLRVEAPEPNAGLPREFEGAETEWKAIFERHRFRDVEQGDRFHISGIDTVFTVATKTNDQSLELSAVAGADIVANAGVWRAHRGAAVDPADILLFDADSSGAPTYHIVHKIVTFG
jgi:glutamine synthetase adenylyltransferase